jgi:hypothetical protein
VSDDRWTRGTRYCAWFYRTARPLDFGSEIWVDPQTRPDYAEFVALARQRGIDSDPSNLGFYMSRVLLRELLFAGGGVEAEFLRLCDAVEVAQTEYNESVANALRADEVERHPDFREYTTSPSLVDAHYAFCNVLSWTRSVAERVERGHRSPNDTDRVGLLPAMASGPRRDRVAEALDAFRERTLDMRHLANYVLHAGAMFTGGSTMAEVQSDGSIRLLLPDPPLARITTFDEFKFSQGRDMRTYAADLMDGVEQLIDAVLTAFEEHLPDRFKEAFGTVADREQHPR